MPEISKKITGEIAISPEKFKETKNVPAFIKEVESSFSRETTEIIETILAGAVSLRTSDIHIEPQEEKAKIRLRVDGLLQDILFFEKEIYEKILSRIKLLSGVKLNISDRPQDGRFSVVFSGSAIEIRVSTLPSEFGESIVLRILNPKSLISLEDLGLRPDLQSLFEKEIKKPNGMIIVTGPTGSGKTTTLYSFLKKIYSPEIKIITIEDPIEYHLDGISQTQVAPEKGYDFASGLKSIVRQDPDVILVGEIRDLETVNIALQAALTGHLVLTTLHTNDAAGTIPRLINLGAKPADIGPAVNVAVAQRLLRKICPFCKKMEKPEAGILKEIKERLKNIPKKIKIPKIDEKTKIPAVVGCEKCNATGYKGRVGVFEAFLVDDEMENLVLKTPSTAALEKKAVKKGMVTMYQDGLIKVLQGDTTLDELEKIVGREE